MRGTRDRGRWGLNMDTYGLDFADAGWPYAEARFCYAVLFDGKLLTTQSTRAFLLAVLDGWQVSRMRLIQAQNTAPQILTPGSFEKFLADDFRWERLDWFDLELAGDGAAAFSGVLEFPSPDCLEIFSPARRFYTGTREGDFRIADQLAALVQLAVEHFGDAHGGFGVEHAPAGRALRMREKQNAPNLPAPLERRRIADQIASRCEEYRLELPSTIIRES